MASSARRPDAVALATATDAWPLDEDALPLCQALEARGIAVEPRVWNDPAARWDDVALVVVRSTWDYAPQREAFLAWSDRVAARTALCNPPAVLRWNTDKAYLHDLEAAGIAVVPTALVEPELSATDRKELLGGHVRRFAASGSNEFVVKPSVSAGSKDTGRFALEELDRAATLCEGIAASGRTTMVQPYLEAVDRVGETGLVYFDGVLSHAFEKGPLLAPGAEAEHGLFAAEHIAPRTATAQERAAADVVMAEVLRRFGRVLYARVDLLRDDDDRPILLELELTEPSWFLGTDPGAAERAAGAIVARLDSPRR